MAILDFLIARAKEGSTWRGLTALLTAVGITLNPDQIAAIAATGMAIGGLIGALWPEKTA